MDGLEAHCFRSFQRVAATSFTVRLLVSSAMMHSTRTHQSYLAKPTPLSSLIRETPSSRLSAGNSLAVRSVDHSGRTRPSFSAQLSVRASEATQSCLELT